MRIWSSIIAIAACTVGCTDHPPPHDGRAAGSPSPTIGRPTTLTGEHAPFVTGQIVAPDIPVGSKIEIGFLGLGDDHFWYSNRAWDTILDGKGFGLGCTIKYADGDQSIWLDRESGKMTYQHLNMKPGSYSVYVRCNDIVYDFKDLAVKSGDRHNIDLKIDPAIVGRIRITMTEQSLRKHADDSLGLFPPGLEPDENGMHKGLAIVSAKVQELTTTFHRVPQGRYIAICGRDRFVVEVLAGKTVSVPLETTKDKDD